MENLVLSRDCYPDKTSTRVCFLRWQPAPRYVGKHKIGGLIRRNLHPQSGEFLLPFRHGKFDSVAVFSRLLPTENDAALRIDR